MRYVVTKQVIEVIGMIWMPAVQCSQYRELNSYDLGNIGDLRDRDAVENWIAMHFGDFQSITDFRADFHDGDENIIHEWKNPDSEFLYSDLANPGDDE